MRVGQRVEAVSNVIEYVGTQSRPVLVAKEGITGMVKAIDGAWLVVTFQNGRTSDVHMEEVKAI